MDCAAILVFYGLRERICACGEWSVDGSMGFIFTYDFLELSVYYFSGSVDIPTDIFNYKEYQQSTPFLIPNRKSILVCLRTIRKND